MFIHRKKVKYKDCAPEFGLPAEDADQRNVKPPTPCGHSLFAFVVIPCELRPVVSFVLMRANCHVKLRGKHECHVAACVIVIVSLQL